ncbi:MAG: ComEA family DNA-binding protein [Dehalococcoidales bacterium]|nr:ComEA family DNA-binding protein [Dehalococcoidales bacterium]
MAQVKPNRFGIVAILFLIFVIIISSVVAWSRYRPSPPIEIFLSPEQEISGNINIDGAVTNPGIYPFSGGDTIGSLIQSAGGVNASGEPGSLELTVPQTNTQEAVQKININRAEAWLLEALPGIGTSKAKAIIDYRQKNGLFRSINELTKVEGISATLLEQIKSLITVSD